MSAKKFFAECIFWFHSEIMIVSASRDAVDNRGEDLRFPISSSSGFSSPMRAFRKGRPFIFAGVSDALRLISDQWNRMREKEEP
jgi:hypothetical protein